ncbi:MAG: hypothetical protein C0608_01110 [Deltaproteobacteria bacterium]|nr:MAG: hypothetical protein C0608_01110 [Deltaproteobacteria bacterium]
MVEMKPVKTNAASNPLAGRKLWIPNMSRGTARVVAGAFHALGIDAEPLPDGDERTGELALRHLTGDECYPQVVTLGNFLKITELEGFDPAKNVLFMAASNGPCRFGQYSLIFRQVLEEKGLGEVEILSPSCENGYRGLGDEGPELFRYFWWAVIAADLLRRMIHRYRPYEKVPGTTDRVWDISIEEAAMTLGDPTRRGPKKFGDLALTLGRARERFRAIKKDLTVEKPLIGVAGEIFCRLNDFSNDSIIRQIEAKGGEAWLADLSEWIFYVNFWEMEELRAFGQRFTKRMLTAKITDRVQRREEHSLLRIFKDDLKGREEPTSVGAVIEAGTKYIPPHAALGEMILSIGKAEWFHKKGCAGMVDISPFSCMNATVAEAIYPKVSEALGGMPIRTFYYDGTHADMEEKVDLFMALARGHKGLS